MPALPPSRSFLLLALVGVLVALAATGLTRAGVAASDAGPMLLVALVAGAALAMFSLVPPALRLLLAGWRRVGIGPRNLRSSSRLADGLTIAVWTVWLAGAAVALPAAWAPMLANLVVT